MQPSHLRLEHLVDELSAEQDRLDVLSADGDEHLAVRSVFSWSYYSLPPPLARMFRLLGLHAGPDLSIHAAAALADTTPARARRMLDALTTVHLLEQSAPDRYQFHDLLRVYAAECAETDETATDRACAVRRVLNWYLHTSHTATGTMYPGFTQPPLEPTETSPWSLTFRRHVDAVRWYDAERVNLVAATRQAAANGEHRTAWKLPANLTGLYYLRQYWTDALDSYQTGLAAARHLGDPYAEAWMLTNLGGAHRDRPT